MAVKRDSLPNKLSIQKAASATARQLWLSALSLKEPDNYQQKEKIRVEAEALGLSYKNLRGPQELSSCFAF